MAAGVSHKFTCATYAHSCVYTCVFITLTVHWTGQTPYFTSSLQQTVWLLSSLPVSLIPLSHRANFHSFHLILDSSCLLSMLCKTERRNSELISHLQQGWEDSREQQSLILPVAATTEAHTHTNKHTIPVQSATQKLGI